MSCPRARIAVAALVVSAAVAGGQESAAVTRPAATPTHIVIGSIADDSVRTHSLGGSSGPTLLVRSASSYVIDTARGSWRSVAWRWQWPAIDMTSNSGTAFSLNDGVQWAGRGVTVAMSGGVHAALGRVRVSVVPAFWSTENRAFAVLPGRDPARSGFASPYHAGRVSADLPVRFGTRAIRSFDLGESALWLVAKGTAAGVSTESQWWGPGIRNAIVMSNNAGGIPHAFVRTAAPIRTRVGSFEGRWIAGALSESRFFDRDPATNLRSLSGIVATYTPVIEPNASIGVARVVYAGIRGAGAMPARALDALLRWGGGFNVRSAHGGRAAEQISAVFGRWVFPEAGAEAYVEWSRMLLPVSVRDLLVAPQFTQGFTVGLQWVAPISDRQGIRLQAELTNLEQSAESVGADTISYYTSSVVPQGYTQRGQSVGAAIGPGGSSQWLAMDFMRRDASWSAGVFAGRIRWDTDMYYTQPTSLAHFAYDASVFGGLRAHARLWNVQAGTELTMQKRYNFLFQNSLYGYSRDDAFDKDNVTLRVRLSR
jgi:hypothetical protein